MNHEKDLREALENLIKAAELKSEPVKLLYAVNQAKEVLNKSKTI